MPTPFDIDIRFFSASTSLRLQASPEDILSASWEFVEAGGTSQIAIELARPFDDLAWSVNGGDIVEIWALGETVPRCRGRIGQYEKSLDLQEKYTLTAYGLMEDMNRVLLDEIILISGGADLSAFVARIADDYAAHRPSIPFVRDIKDTGVSLERLELANSSARAAMDQIASQSGGNVVWGWDIDAATNLDRFYLRPKTSTVGHQWHVGANVKVINAPEELQQLANGIKILGGPAKYPQLITNPSFEIPADPTEGSGSLLDNGGFEKGTSGGDTSPSGNADVEGWHLSSGATRNQFDPGSNHYISAHSGSWYLILDTDGESAYQEVAVTPGAQYTAALYASRDNDKSTGTGTLTIEGRNSSGDVIETAPVLAIAPATNTWTGGQGTTTLSGDALQLAVTFQDPSITTARLAIARTAGRLMIDDVTFNPTGAVGQTGWVTHLQNPGSESNKFLSIDWACRAAAWEGVYGVRMNVVADEDDRPIFAPYPGGTSGGSGYHYKPTPGMTLRNGYRVRMSPGLSSAAGRARIEYYGWRANGETTQLVTEFIDIPNDGAWHFLYQDVEVENDTDTATTQITLALSGWYDVDGATARDAAAGEGSDSSDPLGALAYLRGANFEVYVTAEEVCESGSDAYESFSIYGRQEAAVNNDQIVNWSADAKQWAKAYFERSAVPLRRPRVDLTDEETQIISPGQGGQVRISGLKADLQDWCAKASYSWKSGQLAVSLDLSNERPTWAKLLTNLSASGGGSASTIASVARQGAAAGSGGGGTSTPAQAAIAVDDGATTVAGATQLHFVGATVAADTAAGIADITFSGSGASAATASALGTVETDVTETTPIVYTKATSDTLLAAKEPSLGDPSADGYVLSSTAAGVRSWVAQSGGSYTLPTASSSVLGGVKIGSGLSIAGGVVSVNAAPSSGASIEGADAAGSSAALPDAASTSAMLGWVNPGNSGDGNITISPYLSQTIKVYSAGAWGAVSSVSIPPGGHMFFVPAGSTSWLAFS